MAVFVDTGAWYAACVANDPDHAAAKAFLSLNTEALVTSDLVYAELLTLFRVRGQMKQAGAWIEDLKAGYCQVIRANEQDWQDATKVFLKFVDKQWSFVDCVSRVMMQRLGIRRAFAFDVHFQQFATVDVVP